MRLGGTEADGRGRAFVMAAKRWRTVGETLDSWACAISYALHRGRWAGVRLSRLAQTASLAAVLWVGFCSLRQGLRPLNLVIAVAGVAICAAIGSCERRGFLLFVAEHAWVPSDEPALAPELMIQVRGSGIFTVGDRERYLVEAPVTFWTTQLGEHVLAAQVRPFRLAGLVGVPEDERGWWYAFVDSREVRQVAIGHLVFRGHRRRALQVLRSGERRTLVTYISCDDDAAARTIEHELRRGVRLVEPGHFDTAGAQHDRKE
jgi:hypothetical protein